MVEEQEVTLDKIGESPKQETPPINEAPKEPESPKRLKRASAQIVKIKEISSDMKRVCVAGTVVSKNNDLYSFLIDNGDGNILVLLNDVDRFQKVEVGQFVRVFAKIWGEGDEIELQADVVQDFSKIDKDLYMKLF